MFLTLIDQKLTAMKIITIIFFSLLCLRLASQEPNVPAGNDTISGMSDEDFNELEQKLESEDPSFRFKFVFGNDISFFLAAQKRRPQSLIWIDLITMHFRSDMHNARQLESETDRKILFQNSLQYLTKSHITLKNTRPSDNNEMEKYNYYLGMLNENIAFAAMGAGDYNKAKLLANELLVNNVDTLSFDYGNKIHNANTLLGRVALMEDDVEQAKAYLIKSGEGPTSPQLSSFGPSYILARELLERGEKNIVLDYLDLVYILWADPKNIDPSDSRRLANNRMKGESLKKWKAEIVSGNIPSEWNR
jgi:hypothetical protein